MAIPLSLILELSLVSSPPNPDNPQTPESRKAPPMTKSAYAFSEGKVFLFTDQEQLKTFLENHPSAYSAALHENSGKLSTPQITNFYNALCPFIEKAPVKELRNKVVAVERLTAVLTALDKIEVKDIIGKHKVLAGSEGMKAKVKKKGSGRNAKYSDDAKIKVLAKENPRRKNTHGHKSFEILLKKDVKTIGAFRKAGGRMKDLLWDVEAGSVELAA